MVLCVTRVPVHFCLMSSVAPTTSASQNSALPFGCLLPKWQEFAMPQLQSMKPILRLVFHLVVKQRCLSSSETRMQFSQWFGLRAPHSHSQLLNAPSPVSSARPYPA